MPSLYPANYPQKKRNLNLSPEAADLPALIRDAACVFVDRLGLCAGSFRLPAPDLPPCTTGLQWQNTLFRAAGFRRAHIEVFEVADQFAVLHACILPHLDSQAPIFGFDMVSGQTQATGIFLDYSPVTAAPSAFALSDAVPAAARAKFLRQRERPDWGGIFSTEFFAIRPVCADEVRAAISLAQAALQHYLKNLTASGGPPVQRVVDGHAAYARGQRLNPHTFRMLARHIGMDPARRFIEDVLFPLPV